MSKSIKKEKLASEYSLSTLVIKYLNNKYLLISAFIVLILPVLEARAEILKKHCLLFGRFGAKQDSKELSPRSLERLF